ncbi:MAG: single-stranded DNA-binding protein, partial [Fusobacterium polymorphum]
SKSTNNVMETPVFDDNSSDDMGTPAEIDDEFPF